MKTYVKIRTALTAILCLLVLSFYFSPQMQTMKRLPNTLFLQPGQTRVLAELNEKNIKIAGNSVQVRSSSDESIKDKANVEIDGIEHGDSVIELSLLGVPIKTVKVVVGERKVLYPGGQSIGVTLHTQGALVVGTAEVEGTDINPAKEAGVQPGDVVRSANNVDIENAEHLSNIINDSQKNSIELGILRDGNLEYYEINPVVDQNDGKKRLGLWVRDSTAGVGTLSYYDPTNNNFGALGHAITDIDTKQKLNIKNGDIVFSKIIDIKQGEKGSPGELKGNFSLDEPIGNITSNTEFGIFGVSKEQIINPLYPQGLKIATQDEVVTGPATILTTIDSEGIKEYTCEVIRIQSQSAPAQRGMVIQITDQDLINKTGGIVQGMSGSTILQNDKIVGTVTHVFVNDPTKGYGMFIEWMLSEGENSNKK